MNASIFIFTLLIGIIAFKIFHYINKKSFAKQSNLIPNNIDIVGQAGIIFVLILNGFFLFNYCYGVIPIHYNNVPRSEAIFVAFTILGIVSYFDDKYDLSKKIRFFFQITLTFLSISALKIEPSIIPYKILVLIIIIFWSYIINITNFIDGLNGFLSLNSIFFFLGSILIIDNYSLYNEIIFPLSFISLSIIIAFFFFNFPKAKLFFGDTGAIPLGFIIGYIIIYFFTYKIYLAAIFIFLYPILDVTLTIIEKIFIRKRYPWERLFDYFFLRPVVNGKKSHEYVFYISLVFQISNLLLLIIYLKYDSTIFLFISLILALYKIYHFSKFKKIS